jgi:DNA-binding response OmpR family regulator
MKHILLVEDDESLNRGVSLKLTKEGYHVETAFTLAEARKLFAAEGVDLVICDIGLPDGSGLDLPDQFLVSNNAQLRSAA